MASTQEEGEQISPQRQLALGWSEEDILSVFEHTPPFRPSGSSVTGFPFPPQQPAAWVKFGWPSILKPEVRNHEYAFTALREMPADQTRGVHIPEIYRTFESGTNFFIVMEYIPGKTLRQLLKEPGGKSAWESLTNKIANGIRLLMSIPAPPGQTPGPVGGGLIRHSLFKHETSYCEYSSVDELEDHLNKVSTIRNKDAPTMILERDMCFYYSDFYERNFMFTDDGDLFLIDFDQAGFLPPSFMTFALAESHWAPGLWVGDVLNLPDHNLPAFKQVFYYFAIGVSDFGLPEHKKRKRNRRRREATDTDMQEDGQETAEVEQVMPSQDVESRTS